MKRKELMKHMMKKVMKTKIKVVLYIFIENIKVKLRYEYEN